MLTVTTEAFFILRIYLFVQKAKKLRTRWSRAVLRIPPQLFMGQWLKPTIPDLEGKGDTQNLINLQSFFEVK